MQHSVRYIVMFAAAVCVVCSIFVSSAAVLLRDRQEQNKVLDMQSKVLSVAGLMDADEAPTPDQIHERFEKNIKPVVVELKTGEVAEDINPAEFDQQAAKADPATSTEAPKNEARVQRLPNHALIYQLVDGKEVQALIFPVEGKGLWSTLYGFLALQADANTVKGITFYQHGETPGLGGEVDNPGWKKGWEDRKVFSGGEPKLAVKKGQAGPAKEDPYHVDGLSGATLTSRGVTNLVQFWMGDDGFGPYLSKYRKENGVQ